MEEGTKTCGKNFQFSVLVRKNFSLFFKNYNQKFSFIRTEVRIRRIESSQNSDFLSCSFLLHLFGDILRTQQINKTPPTYQPDFYFSRHGTVTSVLFAWYFLYSTNKNINWPKELFHFQRIREKAHIIQVFNEVLPDQNDMKFQICWYFPKKCFQNHNFNQFLAK